MKRLVNIYEDDALYEVRIYDTHIASITLYRGDFFIGRPVQFEDLSLDVQGEILGAIDNNDTE